MNTAAPIRHDDLGVLLVCGPDSRNFLQGQLTADLQSLTPRNVLLAACNSPQGRAQAVLWIIERDEGIAVITNSALLERTTARLQRYVLRAKVSISTDVLQVGLLPSHTVGAPTEDRSHNQQQSLSVIQLRGHRQLLAIAPPGDLGGALAEESLRWHQDHLQAGYPEVYLQTHEQFVAQMLNLDLLDGISFEKGCYTGQEIVARTHFRGAVKRRMFRYRARCVPPPPATRILSGDQHAGDVVDAVTIDQGCELLAVMNLAQRNDEVELEHSRVRLEKLDLPYLTDSDAENA